VKRLWRSPTLRSMLVYGAAGVGFAGANLILARVLPKDEYALFTLVIALGNLGFSLAPSGVDGIVNRRHLEAGPRLLGRVLAASSTVAVIFAAIGLLGYRLDPSIGLLLFISTAGGGAMLVAAAKFQSEHRFGVSLALIQSPNIVLLFAALAVVLLHAHRASLAILISSAGFVVAAAIGWALLFRERHGKPHRDSDFPWKEALSFAGLEVAGLTLIQLERLVLPHVLPLSDMATYGVLAAIVGSLFRVMQMGVGYTLLPRLRAATSVQQRRQLIAHEARLVGWIVLLGSALLWLLTPLVERSFLAGKYHLAGSLIFAALVSGVTKIMNAFSKATVSALATPRELAILNLLGWAAVVLALVAAIFGARWGLTGVIYGVALGWLVRALTALRPILKHLRLPEVAAGPHAVTALER
jgi:O-antigen/teichoic acid export membrane protein